MTEFIEEFIIIWNNYNNVISIQPNEFDKFIKIINKLRQKSKLEIQEKYIFIELIEIMADTIYNDYVNKYDSTYYQQTKKYEEPELNCCSELLNYLETEVCRDLENEYDNCLHKNFTK